MYQCLVLYSYRFERSLMKSLFEKVQAFSSDILKVNIQYLGFYHENYVLHYGKYNLECKNLFRKNWNNLVHFSFDDRPLDSDLRNYHVEFSITRPNELIFLYNINIDLNKLLIIDQVFSDFPIDYGFVYNTNSNYWGTAYAIGEFDKITKVLGVESLDREKMNKWLMNSEKINSGLLRNVYFENFINNKQLQNVTKVLRENKGDNNLCRFNKINSELTQWIVPKGGLEGIRNIMILNNQII